MALDLAGHLVQNFSADLRIPTTAERVFFHYPHWWIMEKHPSQAPASRKAAMSTSIYFNGFSMGMAPLNRKWKGKAESGPSSAEEGLWTEGGVRWQGLHVRVCPGLCDRRQ